MKNTNNWEDFWKEWRLKDIETDEDLYFQVGRTNNQKPVEKALFDKMNRDIANILSLGEDDILVDMCCGNGLCTYEFRNLVKQIIAVDFATSMIKAATQFKAAENITYCLGGVLEFLEHLNTSKDIHPTKYMMNGGLAYLNPEILKGILINIKEISNENFIAYFTIVPNDLLKWNFYNTPERKQKYLDNVAAGSIINDGIGRWWTPTEVEEICSSLGLKCVTRDQIPEFSDYRMDIIVSSREINR